MSPINLACICTGVRLPMRFVKSLKRWHVFICEACKGRFRLKKEPVEV